MPPSLSAVLALSLPSIRRWALGLLLVAGLTAATVLVLLLEGELRAFDVSSQNLVTFVEPPP